MASRFKLTVGNLTDVGLVRSRNEDYYGKYEGHFGSLFLVCDGMGGHARGDIASRIAVDTIKEYFQGLTDPISHTVERLITVSVEQAHQNILRHVQANPEHQGTGTTLVLLLIKDDQYWYAHVGDSRIYLKQGNTIRQLTRDHSEVQGMVDAGILTPEQAENHPRKNFIMRALGSTTATPDISGPHPLQNGDTFMMCSDGLSGYFQPEEIKEQLTFEPQIACQNLVQIAKDRGGADNITVQVISAGTHGGAKHTGPAQHIKQPTPKKSRMGLYLSLLGLALVLAAAAYVLLVMKPFGKEKVVPPIPIAVNRLAETEKYLDSLLIKITDSTYLPDYQDYLDGFAMQDTLKLKFIADRQDKMVCSILPTRAIYMPYNTLANDRRLKSEDIQFLILVAVAMSETYPNPDSLNQNLWMAAMANSSNLIRSPELDSRVKALIDKHSGTDVDMQKRWNKMWTSYSEKLRSNGLQLFLEQIPDAIPLAITPQPNKTTGTTRTGTSRTNQGTNNAATPPTVVVPTPEAPNASGGTTP